MLEKSRGWAREYIPGVDQLGRKYHPLLVLEKQLGFEPNIHHLKDGRCTRPVQLEALAKQIWPVELSGEELAKAVRTGALNQKMRPSDLNVFFRGEQFDKWLTKHNFKSVFHFTRALGIKPIKEPTGDSEKPFNYRLDLISMGEFIWPQTSVDKVLKGIKKVQATRPSPLEAFFHGDVFAKWLEKNNFPNLTAFFDYMDCIRSHPPGQPKQPYRQPHFDYPKLADEIWTKPDTRKLLKDLRKSFPERPKNLAEFYPSEELRTWFQARNIRTLSELMKAIGVKIMHKEMESGTKNVFNRHEAARLIWGKEAAQKRFKPGSARISPECPSPPLLKKSSSTTSVLNTLN